MDGSCREETPGGVRGPRWEGGASASPGRDLIFNQFVVENECLRGQPGPLVIATRKYAHRVAFQVPADSSPLDIKGAE